LRIKYADIRERTSLFTHKCVCVRARARACVCFVKESLINVKKKNSAL